MEEAEGFLLLLAQSVPVGAGGFEEVEGADDVGLDELGGAMDRAIHMGLGGKVDDGAGAVLG